MQAIEQPDSELVTRARRGEQDAFRALYAQHAAAVFRLLRSLGVRSADLDDAAQEVFLTAFQKLGAFDDGRSFRSWVLGIAVNISRRHLSRTYWRSVLMDLVKHEPMTSAPISPDASAEQRERAARVGAVLDRMGEKKRTVLVLRDVMEFDEGETAASLGIPRGTVATRLYHARREFARIAKRFHLDPRASGDADG